MAPSHLLALLQMIDQAYTRLELAAAGARVIMALGMVVLVYRLVRRVPWPRPFRPRFLLFHVLVAPAIAFVFLVFASAATSLITGRPFLPTMLDIPEEFLLLGVISYTVIAGVSYAAEATARAARAEAAAAQTQLAALRAQLEPHFLFNALHTVVQLIRSDPDRAVEAAELVADLLRTTLDEQRDVVSLRDEWVFVSRYLELERIRFGDRLRVAARLDPELLDVRVPSFALQTLVENAVRHGAAPRTAPTDIVLTAAATSSELTLTVRNTGEVGSAGSTTNRTGSGLRRLRERISVIHGSAARLAYGPHPEGGFEAVLILPREAVEE